MPATAKRERADVMLMPSNLTARPGRIPQVVTVLDVNFLTESDTDRSSICPGGVADEGALIMGSQVASRYTWSITARAMSSALHQVVAESSQGI